MLNRRDFLKLLLLVPLFTNRRINKNFRQFHPESSFQSNQPNIFIFLFDTLSARHISLYGYNRETMPNLSKFAEIANVYHQHHSGGNMTPTGTASLLTGTYPWYHRSFTLHANILDEFSDRNIFSETKDSLRTIAYTQNFLAKNILTKFNNHIDISIPMWEGGVYNDKLLEKLFQKDYLNSHWALDIIKGTWELPASSPFLSLMRQIIFNIRYHNLSNKLQDEYPIDPPTLISSNIFLDPKQIPPLIKSQVEKLLFPSINYYHFFPPHGPYKPTQKYYGLFNDNWNPTEKPNHIFSQGFSQENLNKSRLQYDQYIANVDNEFGEILDILNQFGLMDNSYVIFTSDHGESFERGIFQHDTQVLYESLLHIPLLIHKPSQNQREDFFIPTSAVDILPTICQLVSQPIPEWVEGEVLPGFNKKPINLHRTIFGLEAKENSKFAPLTIATIAMIKWPYKLIHYFGYDELPYHFELYNLEADPEELNDIYSDSSEISQSLKYELIVKLIEVNEPYSRKD